MRSTDEKTRKYLSRALGVGILALTILIVHHFAALSFDKPRDADYYNYDINRMEKDQTPVDMIIVGASQVYHGCNPEVISAEMSIGEVIDCGAAIGYIDGLYYMLRDLLDRFEPECVVVDMPWHRFRENHDPAARTGMYLCSDRMKMTDKIDYALHCYEMTDWANMSPVYRYGKQVWSLGQLKRNYHDRKAVAEGRWDEAGSTNYQKNGFSWTKKSCPQGSIPALNDVYSDEDVSEYIKKYIRMMRDLCQEKGVPMIFMTIPRSLMELYGVENYQDAIDCITDYAKELDCPYLNFTYLKEREEIFPDPLFSDKVHLNGEGSIVFSRILADAVAKTLAGESTDDLFYGNLDEVKKDVHRIAACNGRVRANGDGTLSVEAMSFQNDDVTPEYRLMLIDALEAEIQDGEAEGDEDSSLDGVDKSVDGLSDIDQNSANGLTGTGENQSTVVNLTEADEDQSSAGNQTGTDQSSVDDYQPTNLQELRPWQEEPTFLISEDEIPEGYALRLEARQKGEEQADAYVNRLTDDFRINRNG